MEKSRQTKDDFWDISALVPPRAKPPKRPYVARDTDTVEITSATRDADRPYRAEDVVLTEHYVHPPVREEKPEPLFAYAPTDSLLHEVRVYAWGQRYDYYERFRAHARGLLQREGVRCDSVPFFSYMPQYEQMSASQLSYYLWWRTNFRNGNYLEAEFSYLLLYLYELINVCDVLPPAEVQDAMLRLWTNYRCVGARMALRSRVAFQTSATRSAPKGGRGYDRRCASEGVLRAALRQWRCVGGRGAVLLQ